MVDADDSESWLSSALRCSELAAHQIARFRSPWWNPTWQDLVPGDPPPALSFTVGWGLRGKRSRPAVVRFVKRDAAACSPATPFDFGSGSGSGSGSGASTSGGEEGSSSHDMAAVKRGRAGGDGDDVSGAGGGCETKVVGIERTPFAYKIPPAKDIRRTGKKKTLSELQEEGKALLEEKNQLQKELALKRKSYEALQAENQRLKSQQVSFLSQRVLAKTDSAAPSSSSQFILPDLNEPLSENLD